MVILKLYGYTVQKYEYTPDWTRKHCWSKIRIPVDHTITQVSVSYHAYKLLLELEQKIYDSFHQNLLDVTHIKIRQYYGDYIEKNVFEVQPLWYCKGSH